MTYCLLIGIVEQLLLRCAIADELLLSTIGIPIDNHRSLLIIGKARFIVHPIRDSRHATVIDGVALTIAHLSIDNHRLLLLLLLLVLLQVGGIGQSHLRGRDECLLGSIANGFGASRSMSSTVMSMVVMMVLVTVVMVVVFMLMRSFRRRRGTFQEGGFLSRPEFRRHLRHRRGLTTRRRSEKCPLFRVQTNAMHVL